MHGGGRKRRQMKAVLFFPLTFLGATLFLNFDSWEQSCLSNSCHFLCSIIRFEP